MCKLSFTTILSIAFSISLCAQMNTDYVPCNDMPNIMQGYYADVTALNRVYIVNGSPEKRERYKKLAQDYINKLNLLSFASLPQECQADYVLFKRDLAETVFQAEIEATEYDAVKQWFPFVDSIYRLEKIRRRGGNVDGRSVALNFSQMTKQLKQLEATLKTEKNISVKDSRRASVIINGLQAALKNIFTFYNAYDPLFTWWVPDTYRILDSSLAVYTNTFKMIADKNAPNKDSSG
ncbi:MAG: hypothetical protein ABIS01_08200, partial [Ferruginibacter sp.]